MGKGSLGSRRDSEGEERGDREALPTFGVGGGKGCRGRGRGAGHPLAAGKAEGYEMPSSGLLLVFLGGRVKGSGVLSCPPHPPAPPPWLPSVARLPSPTR